jgi:hypothetical protein
MARTGILYGDSNTYKTTAGKFFSHYIYEVTGKKTLLLSMDGGGWAAMDPEIKAGVIKAYRCNQEVPLPVLRKVSQGFFPLNSDETDIAKTDMRMINWDEFGGMIVEGVTSISQSIMRHLADKGIKTGEEATNQFGQNVIVNGKLEQEKFAGNSRGHYGFVQNFLYSIIQNFGALPCHYVLLTGLESRTEEDDRTTVYGPQIAGKKATNLVPSWVGDCIHAQGYPVNKEVMVPDPADRTKKIATTVVDTVVRYYFTKHPDPNTGILFPAKTRVTPDQIPKLMETYPGGYFEPTLTEGFDTYLHLIDKLSGEHGVDLVNEWRAKVDAKRAALKKGPATAVSGNIEASGHLAEV